MDPKYRSATLRHGSSMSTMLWANELRINKVIPDLQAQASHTVARFRVTERKFEETESQFSSLLATQTAALKEDFGRMLTAQTQLQQRNADAKLRRVEDGHTKVMEDLQRRLEAEQKLRMDLQDSVTAHITSNNQRYSELSAQLQPVAARVDHHEELHMETSKHIQNGLQKCPQDCGELQRQVEKLHRASDETSKHNLQRFDGLEERFDKLYQDTRRCYSQKLQIATKTPPRSEASISTDSEVPSPFTADHAMESHCAVPSSNMLRHLPDELHMSQASMRSIQHKPPLESYSGAQIADVQRTKPPQRTSCSKFHPTATSISAAPVTQDCDSPSSHQQDFESANDSSHRHSSVVRHAKIDMEELTLLSSSEDLTMRPSDSLYSGVRDVPTKLHTDSDGVKAYSISYLTKERNQSSNAIVHKRSAKTPETCERSCMYDSTLPNPRNIELPTSTTGAELDQTHMTAHTLRDSVNVSSESINPSLLHPAPGGDPVQGQEISIDGETHPRVRTTAEEVPRKIHAAFERKTLEDHRKTNVIRRANERVRSPSFYEHSAGPRRSKRIYDKTITAPSQSEPAPRSFKKATGPKKTQNASTAASRLVDGQLDDSGSTCVDTVVKDRNKSKRPARSTTQSTSGEKTRNENEVSHNVTSLTSVRKRSRMVGDAESSIEGKNNAAKRPRLIVVLPMKFPVPTPP